MKVMLLLIGLAGASALRSGAGDVAVVKTSAGETSAIPNRVPAGVVVTVATNQPPGSGAAAGVAPTAGLTFSRPGTTFSRPESTFSSVGSTFSRPESTFSRPEGTFSRPGGGTFSRPESTFSRPVSTFSEPIPPTSPAPVLTFSRPISTFTPQQPTFYRDLTFSPPASTLAAPALAAEETEPVVFDLPPGATLRRPGASPSPATPARAGAN